MKSPLLLLTLLPVVPSTAQTLKSAPEILSKQTISNPQQHTIWGDSSYKPGSAAAAWMADARALRRDSGKNSAQTNARAWLSLARRRLEMKGLHEDMGEQRPGFSYLMQALSGPSNWTELLKVTRAEFIKTPTAENAAHYYLAARLNNTRGEQVQALRALFRALEPRAGALAIVPNAKTAPHDYAQESRLQQEASRLNSLCSLLLESPDVAQRAAGLKLRLSLVPRLPSMYFEIPDMVTLFGEKAAKPLLKKIMLSNVRLTWYEAGETDALARRMWLNDPQLQKRPLWDLVTSVQDWKFALAMLQRFPNGSASGEHNYAINRARSYVLSGLLRTNQSDEATRKIKAWVAASKNKTEISFPYLDEEAPREVQLQQLRWVESTLRRHPQLDWSEGHAMLALRLGQTKERLAMLREEVQKKGFAALPVERRYSSLKALSGAYLMEDDVQNGGATLLRAFQLSLKGQGDLGEDVTALLRLNRVAPRGLLLNAARNGAKAILSKPAQPGDERSRAGQLTRIALLLAEQKQTVFAQSLLVGAFQARKKPVSEFEMGDSDRPASQEYLYGLMAIYQRANRPADMVYLLEHANGWGEKELTPLLTFDGKDPWSYEIENPEAKTMPKLGYLAAWALARTNRRAEAAQVAKALLDRAPGTDSAYRLLCDLQREAARPFLKKMAAADRFEERPLIWQAYLSRRAGKWLEAQQLAKEAIAIDPSDGEQGPGDRLRAYAELAAALRGAGRTAQAKEMETAVSAIRLAEQADYARIAGLSMRAIGMYKKSLSYFDDAYCVQSRLAVQLVGLGRYQEASQHFRRAYELMPVSFGRLESHCFGCEGVFGGKMQNSIAKEVFLQLEKARPRDAKIAYLSGYWRSTAGEEKAATTYFRRAVTLDPLYLSAWVKLRGMGQYLTPMQQDQATLQLIKLDPKGMHQGDYSYGLSFAVKQDYRGLWATTAQVLTRKSVVSKANFALKNSSRVQWSMEYGSWEQVKKPADAIAYQSFVMNLSNLLA
jgi:tetratricopeptide (TPR) repeat protein